MLIGACDPCSRLFEVDLKVLPQGYCPNCRKPLRLLTPREADQTTRPVERHPSVSGDDSAGSAAS